MKTLFKWAFRACLLLIVLLVAAVLLFDTAMRALAESRIRAETGLEVRLGRLEIGLLNPKVTIENFVLYNAAEFGGAPMVDLPELHVEYDRPALREGRLHLKLIRFNLAEVNVVRSKEGKSNFDELKTAMEPKPKREQKVAFGGIDALNLTLGKLRLTDLREPDKAREFNLGIKNQIFTDLNTQQDFESKLLPVLLRAGAQTLTELWLAPAPRGAVKPAP